MTSYTRSRNTVHWEVYDVKATRIYATTGNYPNPEFVYNRDIRFAVTSHSCRFSQFSMHRQTFGRLVVQIL